MIRLYLGARRQGKSQFARFFTVDGKLTTDPKLLDELWQLCKKYAK